jgi:protein TonB
MLERLLESRSTRPRSVGGTMASVTAHTALIAGALYATAQARVEPARTAEMVHPVYFPRSEASASATTRTAAPPIHLGRLQFVAPRIDVEVASPSIDMSGIISTPTDFGGSSTLATHDSGAGGGSVATDAPLRADQVEKQVALVPGSAPPRYPELLRSSGVEGQVTAVFVVDERGRAEEVSIRFMRSDNRLFEDAVKEALRRMRFVPAEVGGRKVRQLVQMPFVFTLAR